MFTVGLPVLLGGLLLSYGFLAVAAYCLERCRLKSYGEEAREASFLTRLSARILERFDHHALAIDLSGFLCAGLFGWYALLWLLSVLLESSDASQTLAVVMQEPNVAAVGALGLLSFVLAALSVFLAIQLTKGLVRRNSDAALRALAIPILAISTLLVPVTWFVLRVEGALRRRFGLHTSSERDLGVSAEELSEIVEHSSEVGEIDQDEKEMLQGVFTFADTVVNEVMTPRKDVVTVSEMASLEELARVIKEKGRSRLLVVGRELDDVKGVLLTKDLVPYLGSGAPEFNLKKVLRQPYFIPGTKRVDELMVELKRRAIHLAVVLDEHGGVDGVVTLEDLLEEIVGEIYDEYDSSRRTSGVTQLEGGDLLVEGGTLVEDLNISHELGLPNGEYNTVAGLVFHLLGRVPAVGEIVEHEEVRLRVEEVQQNRITKLRILSGKTPYLAANNPNSLNKSESKIASPQSNIWGEDSKAAPKLTVVGTK